jgi:hypothetical protein
VKTQMGLASPSFAMLRTTTILAWPLDILTHAHPSLTTQHSAGQRRRNAHKPSFVSADPLFSSDQTWRRSKQAMPTSTSQQPLDHPRRRPRAPSCSTLVLSAMMLLHRSVGAFLTQVCRPACGGVPLRPAFLPPSLPPSHPLLPNRGSSFTYPHLPPHQNTGPLHQQQALETAVHPARQRGVPDDVGRRRAEARRDPQA